MQEAANYMAASPFRDQACEVLFKLGRDARKLVVQRSAKAIDHGDDSDRDAGGNQAVFNSGRARLILQKRGELGHKSTPYWVRHMKFL